MIGLSTYAFFWQHSVLSAKPLGLAQMLRETHALGVGLFQICDFAAVEMMTPDELAGIRALADELGITLELGTRGVSSEHMVSYLTLACALDAALIRTMVSTPTQQQNVDEAAGLLRDIIPEFEKAGVTLALETYEQVSTADLVRLVESVASPRLGICLDPANTVARLEHPRDVIDRTTPFVVNLHVKDFAFERKDGSVGFSLSGRPLGEGMLPYDYLNERVRPGDRNINQIIEHWLPRLSSIDETLQIEKAWTSHSLSYLRSK